jgi:hypothetical protein
MRCLTLDLESVALPDHLTPECLLAIHRYTRPGPDKPEDSLRLSIRFLPRCAVNVVCETVGMQVIANASSDQSLFKIIE